MNGLWTATFSTPRGSGYGVAVFGANDVLGGDSATTYIGTYEVQSNQITAKLRITPFNNSAPTVFGGNQPLDLTITGTVTGNVMTGRGSAAQFPGVPFQVTLKKVK